MTYPSPRTNGKHALADRRFSIRELRSHLAPPTGMHWFLDPAPSDLTLTTSHPVLGARRYPLAVTTGMLVGMDHAQFDLALTLACPGMPTPMPVMFKSASVSRRDAFRYLAKGNLYIGDQAGIAVMHIHDLSWVTGKTDSAMRILTIMASLDRHFWVAADWIPRPWLTRNTAEIFLHTEWRPDCPVPPGA